MGKRVAKWTPYYVIWSAEDGRRYAQKVLETGAPFDDRQFESGNYYGSLEAAMAVIRAWRLAVRREKEKEKEYSRRHYAKCGKRRKKVTVKLG